MEDDVVSIDAILCDCCQDEEPKTWRDHVKEWTAIVTIALCATIIFGLACVGALDLALGMIISLS